MARSSRDTAPVGAPIPQAPSGGGAGGFWSAKHAGVPTWAWVGGGTAIVIAGVWIWRSKSKSSSSTATSTPTSSASTSPSSTSPYSTSPYSTGGAGYGGGGYGSGGYGSSPGSTAGWNPSGQPMGQPLSWLPTAEPGYGSGTSNPSQPSTSPSNTPATTGSFPSGYRQYDNIQQAIAATRNGQKVLWRNNQTGHTGVFQPGSGTTPSGATLEGPSTSSQASPQPRKQFKNIQQAIAAERSGQKVYYRNNQTGKVGIFKPGSGTTPSGATLY